MNGLRLEYARHFRIGTLADRQLGSVWILRNISQARFAHGPVLAVERVWFERSRRSQEYGSGVSSQSDPAASLDETRVQIDLHSRIVRAHGAAGQGFAGSAAARPMTSWFVFFRFWPEGEVPRCPLPRRC